MITKIKNKSDGYKRSYISSDYSYPEEMMSSKQRSLLTELILTKIYDEESREGYLSQISDEMTSSEANEMIFELEMAKY
jgi:hypothetical protein